MMQLLPMDLTDPSILVVFITRENNQIPSKSTVLCAMRLIRVPSVGERCNFTTADKIDEVSKIYQVEEVSTTYVEGYEPLTKVILREVWTGV